MGRSTFPNATFCGRVARFPIFGTRASGPNGWRTIISSMVMWRVNSNGQEDLTVDEFLFCYEPCQIALSPGFWTFKNRDADTRIV